jgi:hypothetical protein
MSFQLIQPNTATKDYAGYCLRFTQSVYNAPIKHATAWDAWEATQHKFYSREMPDVSVPVWFDHWGTYGEYGQYGHVVAYIPGRGFLSSPTSGYGQKWLDTIEQVEATYNSTFVGWTEDINGLQVAKITQPTKLTNGKEMYIIKDANGSHFLVTPNGVKIVTDLYDVEMLRLALTSDPNKPTVFAVDDVPRINKYLGK